MFSVPVLRVSTGEQVTWPSRNHRLGRLTCHQAGNAEEGIENADFDNAAGNGGGGAGEMCTAVMEVVESGVVWTSFHASLRGQKHPTVFLKGKAENAKFQAEMGPYDLIPTPEDASIAASLGGRPVFKQRAGGTSVMYWIDDCWAIGTRVGSFQDVSFFAQDTCMSPCDIASEWYELAGEQGASSNPSVCVLPLSTRHATTKTRSNPSET